MSLDITLIDPTATYRSELHSQNITHNLNKMAMELWLYETLRNPKEWTQAKDIVNSLIAWIKELKKNPEKYKKYNPENKRWSYEWFIEFLEELVANCEEYPEALIESYR